MWRWRGGVSKKDEGDFESVMVEEAKESGGRVGVKNGTVKESEVKGLIVGRDGGNNFEREDAGARRKSRGCRRRSERRNAEVENTLLSLQLKMHQMKDNCFSVWWLEEDFGPD